MLRSGEKAKDRYDISMDRRPSQGSWEEGGEGGKRGESAITFPKSSWCLILCMLNFKYHVIPFLLTSRTKN